jgi:hypothetical protein
MLSSPHICLGISGLTDDHGFDDFSVNFFTPHMRGAYFFKYRRCDTQPSLLTIADLIANLEGIGTGVEQ